MLKSTTNNKILVRIAATLVITAMLLTLGAASGAFSHIADSSVAAFSSPNYRNLNLTPGGETDEMRFTWHSQSEVGSVRIYRAGTPVEEINSTTQVLTARSADSEWFPGDTADYTAHHVIIENLLPSTDYEYVIVGENFESAPKSFRTGGDDVFRFLAVGDPQIGINYLPIETIFHNWNNAVNVATAQVPQASFMLSLGDQIWSNRGTNPPSEAQLARSQYMYDVFFSPPAFHSLPIVPVIGNHEVGSDNANGVLWHLNYGTVNPENGGYVLHNTRRVQSGSFHADFYMRWGDMLLIQLDSHVRGSTSLTPGSSRYDWLTDVLDRHSDATWRVAAFHHPPYSSFRATDLAEKTELIANWIPALERHNFDVVLNGHCHAYARTRQLYNNAPILHQQWIDENGNVNAGTTATNAVLNPTGIVYVVLNTATASGFYNVAAIDDREYLAVYNQNFMRNFSVVEVTPNTFSIATYQVNDDDSTTLVDVYTIVRSDNNEMPNGVIPRQMGDTQWGTYLRSTIEDIYVPAGTTLEEIEELLPAQVLVETDIRNNDFGTTASIRNPRDEYGRFVRPLTADVVWDISSATPTFMARAANYQIYTVSGSIVGVAGGDVEITATVGDPPTPFNGYISYFGARYRFYGRSNYARMDEAFDPEIFSTWVGGGANPRGAPTPIGFGTPMSAANAGPGNYSGALATEIPDGVGPHMQRGTRTDNNGVETPNVRHTFTYFSRTFYLPDDFDVNDIVSVRGAHHIDDVLVLFINGEEVYRFNTTSARNNVFIGRRPSTLDNWNWWVGANTDARLRTFHIDRDYRGSDPDGVSDCGILFQAASRTNLNEALRPGQNVITAAVGNSSAGLNDLWFNLELYLQLDYPSFTALNLAIENAETINPNVYTAESLQAMQSALSAAIEVRESDSPTQDEVNYAVATLNAAIRNLMSNGYISYFGARYRFYGRTGPMNVRIPMADAFNPVIFSNWVGGGAIPQGAPTPIGFGAPMSVANAGAENHSGALATTIPLGTTPYQQGTSYASGANRRVHTFTYFSRTFNLPEDFYIGNIGEVLGAHHIDDNMILFINGIEVYRFNSHATPANVEVGRGVGWYAYLGRGTDARLRRFHINYDYNARDSGYRALPLTGQDNLFHAASRTNLELALRPGDNVITAAVGNNSATSSDLWFNLELFIEQLEEPIVPEIIDVVVGVDEVIVSLIRPRGENAFLIAATYNYDGSTRRMINSQLIPIVPRSGGDITIPIEFTNANRVKVMMWDLRTMEWLSDYEEREI